MRECMNVNATVNRLKRIEGRIRGSINLVETGEPCESILVQIGAAKSALHKAGQTILEGHLHHCVLDGIEQGKADDTLKKLARAIEQFSRMS